MANLQDLENKGDVLQDLGNAGVMVSLELLAGLNAEGPAEFAEPF
jgi:hypothetical protein